MRRKPHRSLPATIDRRSADASATIFISYRHEDTSGYVGRLYDRLNSQFTGRVFRDISTVQPGVDLVDLTARALDSCAAFLVVIGPRWLTTDSSGRRRLENPGDFVRLEIVAALRRNVWILPVLVQGAKMPGFGELPEELRPLERRSAIELSDTRWAYDMDRLAAVVAEALAQAALGVPISSPSSTGTSSLLELLSAPNAAPATVRWRSRLVLAAVPGLLLVGWLYLYFLKPARMEPLPVNPKSTKRQSQPDAADKPQSAPAKNEESRPAQVGRQGDALRATKIETPRTFSIVVVVKDETTGDWIPGVRIESEEQAFNHETDDHGRCTVSVRPGLQTVRLKLSKQGYESQTSEVSLFDGMNPQEFILRRSAE
jgi:hypothetical protein